MVTEKIDVSIVVLNYNTKDFLLKCLQSIKESSLSGINTEVVVVDNASNDGSVESITSTTGIKSITSRIIENKKNVGFSAGNNIGVKHATGRYVLFLNPDTVLPKNALRIMYEFMEEHKDVGVASPRLQLADGTLDEASHRGFPTPWNAFCHFSGLRKLFPKSRIFAGYTLGWLLDDKESHEVDSVSGAFFFVRKEAGEEVSWWDEDYFWNADDLDFCFRLKEKRWKIMFVPQIMVLHYRGVASGIKGHSRTISTATQETRVRAAYASTEAMRIFYKKHYARKYPKVVMGLVLFGVSVLEKIRTTKVNLQ